MDGVTFGKAVTFGTVALGIVLIGATTAVGLTGHTAIATIMAFASIGITVGGTTFGLVRLITASRGDLKASKLYLNHFKNSTTSNDLQYKEGDL